MTTIQESPGALVIRRTIEEISLEIRLYQRQTLHSAVEVGRRLEELKENFADTKEYFEYVKEEFDISRSGCYSFIRLFTEYGTRQYSLFGAEVDNPKLGNLNFSKALALLAVPADEREEFIETNHVDDISVRELKALIAEKEREVDDITETLQDMIQTVYEHEGKIKDLTDELESLDDKVKARDNDIAAMSQVINDKDQIIDSYEKDLEKYNARIQELDSQPDRTAEDNEELKRLKAELHDMEFDLKLEREQKSNLLVTLENVRADAKAEIEALRSKPPQASAPTIDQFKWLFKDWQTKTNELMEFPEASDANEQDRERMMSALFTALNKALSIVIKDKES